MKEPLAVVADLRVLAHFFSTPELVSIRIVSIVVAAVFRQNLWRAKYERVNFYSNEATNK